MHHEGARRMSCAASHGTHLDGQNLCGVVLLHASVFYKRQGQREQRRTRIKVQRQQQL